MLDSIGRPQITSSELKMIGGAQPASVVNNPRPNARIFIIIIDKALQIL